MQTTLFVGGICHSHVTTKQWVTRQTTYPLLLSSSPIQATIQHSHVDAFCQQMQPLNQDSNSNITYCNISLFQPVGTSYYMQNSTDQMYSSGSPHFWRVVDFWQCGSAIVAEFHWLVQAPNERSNPPLAARGLECARSESKTVKLKTIARSLLVRCDSREIRVPTVCCCLILQTCWGMMDRNRWEMVRNSSKAKHPTVRDPETQALFMQSA